MVYKTRDAKWKNVASCHYSLCKATASFPNGKAKICIQNLVNNLSDIFSAIVNIFMFRRNALENQIHFSCVKCWKTGIALSIRRDMKRKSKKHKTILRHIQTDKRTIEIGFVHEGNCYLLFTRDMISHNTLAYIKMKLSIYSAEPWNGYSQFPLCTYSGRYSLPFAYINML